MGHPRRLFTREFKVEAVKLVTEQRRSFAKAPCSLAFAENLLRKQALQAVGDQAFPDKGHLPLLEGDLRRLRAEDKRLQMGRTIKKRRPSLPRSPCEVSLHRRIS